MRSVFNFIIEQSEEAILKIIINLPVESEVTLLSPYFDMTGSYLFIIISQAWLLDVWEGD